MTLLKRLAATSAVIMALVACLGLAGCGEPVAATYDGGQITEEDVTTTIKNMRVYYGLTDDAAWDEFIKTRSYDMGESGSMQTAVEKAAAGAAAAASQAEDGDQPEGTVEDLRSYVIEQLIRSELIEKEIKDRDIQVSEEEIDAYVEQQRAYIESRIMEGVFESVLERQGYKNLDEYKEGIREQLKQFKLQQAVSTVTGDDGQEISGKVAWNIWFDDVYEKANPKINPAPDSLDYSVAEASEQSSEDGASASE